MVAILQTPAFRRLPFHPLPSLSAATLRPILLCAVWMAVWYGAWLWLGEAYADSNALALLPVIAGFAPLLLWSLYDYRRGLLLTVIATPLLIAPVIPHNFTQGFGDWFAVCSIVGFVFRHPKPRQWLGLWRPGYGWFIFILAAAAISLAASPVIGQTLTYGIKYGIAEMLGYCLDFGFLAILVHSIRDKRDFRAVLYGVGAGLLVVMAYSAVGLVMTTLCTGNFYGPRTPLTSNQTISSTFGSANYHAAYLITVLPLAFLLYLRSAGFKFASAGMAVLIALIALFIEASTSRAALLMLIALSVSWVGITRFKKETRAMSVVLLLMLPVTVVAWWYPICTCPDGPKSTCPFKVLEEAPMLAPLVQAPSAEAPGALVTLPPPPIVGAAKPYLREFDLDTTLLKTTKGNGGWQDKARIQLMQNAIFLWGDNPISGVGVGLMPNYSYVFGQANRAHNMILTIAAEQGIIGVLAWSGWVGYLMLVLWRARPKAIAYNHAFIFLVLAFAATMVESAFMDLYRMLWVWQLSALILAWPVVERAAKG